MSGPDFLNIIAPPEWMADGLCAQVDPELFFPEKGDQAREAKRLCAGCDVRAECLAHALAHREAHGVWGGCSERERRRMHRPVRPVVRRGPSGRRPDKREGVVRQLTSTLTDPEIAVRLGCSPRTVLRIRAAAGIPAARPSGDNRVGAA